MTEDIMDGFNPPSDWHNPNWFVQDRIHNWRNYVSEALKAEWECFTKIQQIIISANFDKIASNEDWD